MFTEGSRYEHVEGATYESPDGRRISYKRRRFLPRGSSLSVLSQVVVSSGERLDQLAWKTLGDPQQYWQICDANDALKPSEVTRESQGPVRIPVPQFRG